MRLRRLVLFLSAAVAAVFSAFAGLTADDAAAVARRFSRAGSRLGVGLGGEPVSTRRHLVRDGIPFYSVRMRDRGTVFVSEENGPVVAFTAESVDFDALASDSPLRALLERDAKVRANIAALGANDSSPYYSDHTNRVLGVDDIRVAPLVKTKWSQGLAGGHYCFNYYTPNHYVCGCTATAMAQLMRYYEYPVDPISPVAKQCRVDNSGMVLTTQGGVYEWSKMTLEPNSGNYNDESWAAIGKLTSDVGIALESDYGPNGTGANPDSVANVLTGTFGYPNAVMYGCDNVYFEAVGGDGLVRSDRGLHNRANRQNMICANLDAGRPVMLAIYGYSVGHVGDSGGDYFAGHAVVGDGYGYCDVGGEKVPYIHLNLGWGGADDAWYNVPEICTAKTGAAVADNGYDFTIFYGCVGNIFTDRTGGEIVSGRVIDTNGLAVASAEVSIEGVGTVMTGENGIYSFIVPSDTRMDVFASFGAVTGVVDVTTGCSSGASIGNRWGVDIVLGLDTRERTVPTNFYVSASFGINAPGRGTYAAPYATIQYAITNGQPLASGDVIHVLPGTYYGCVESPSTSVSIVSTDGPEVTLIDGDGRDCCYYGEANPDNLLSGFTITNGAYYGGICIGTATNCVIVGCASGSDVRYGYGGGASSASLYGCVIHNNEADYGGGAAGCVLVNCTVYDNWAYFAGGGVDCDCAVTNSIVWRNWADVDDLVENWERNESPSSWGSVVKCSSFTCSCTFPDGFEDLGGNITNEPMCVSFDVDDWRLRIGSPCAGAGLWGLNMGAWQGDPLPGYVISAEVNGRGSVLPRSRFVIEGEDAVFTASGDHPFLGMETNGVLASVERLFVWRNVRADGLLTACFGVTNYCVDAAVGDDGNDGLSWAAPLKTIFGMVQKAGRGDRAAFRPGVYDGCEWCVYGVEAESTDGPSVTIIDGGGTNRCVYADEMVYRGFTFRNGNAWVDYGGGALYGAFVDCVFSNCTAAYGGAAAGSVMTNCLVVGNRAESYQSNGRNIGGYGGGVYESVLVNCTVADNTAYRYGGGAYLHSQGEARNSIICGNMSESGSSYGNDVYGNHYWTMSNSLSDVDAKFRDAANGDYRILPSSPAVDAGSIDFVSVNCDLAGTNRTWGAAVDIGCYEYHLPPCVTDPTDIGVAAALAAEGYCGEYSAAVTEPKDYAYLIEWARDHGLAASDLNASPTGFISPALNADGLLDLDPTNLVLKSFVPLSGNGWNLLLTMPGYEIAKVNIPLLKAAIGLIGSGTLDGVYSADGLDITVTPAMDDVEIKIAIPEASPDYFLKVTIR